jgi:hypothetical protein
MKSKRGDLTTGQMNGSMNGHIGPAYAKRPIPTRNVAASLMNLVARLFVWYAVITALFRCPSDVADLTADSSKLCKPYLITRAHAAPYVKPYYDAYLAPYVDLARPHTAKFHQDIYTPASAFVKHNYDQYGAHYVTEAQKHAIAEWDRSVVPQFTSAQEKAKEQYQRSLAPHVDKAYSAAYPYYNRTRHLAVDQFHQRVLPAYKLTLPHAQKAYEHIHHIAVYVIFPYLRQAGITSVSFVRRTLWPHVRSLYGENVEPQLVRIGERLGRYKNENVVDSVAKEASRHTTSASSAVSAASSSVSSVASDKASSVPIPNAKDAQDPEEKVNPEEVAAKVREDLRNWQENFAKAADKGSDDLKEQVRDISQREINREVQGVGEKMINKLRKTSDSATKDYKGEIKAIVKDLPSELTEEAVEAAYKKSDMALRAAGANIRQAAMDIRSWKQRYDETITSQVQQAAKDTVEILDNIRNLGLQEVGMRWAWMKGVTAKDWSKYNELKRTMAEWKNEVEDVALQHKDFAKAKSEGTRIEEQAMTIAEEAAKELRRLKDAARWKIHTRDFTDDFSSKIVPAPVYKAVKDTVDDAQAGGESAIKSASSLAEPVKSAAQGVYEKAEAVIGAAVGDPEDAPVDSSELEDGYLAEKAHASGESLASAATEAVKQPKKVAGGAMAQFVAAREIVYEDEPEDSVSWYSAKVESMVNEAGGKAAALTKVVGDAIRPTRTQGSVDSVTSIASEQYENAFSAASRALYGTEPGFVESLGNAAQDRYQQAVTAASHAVYGTPAAFTESVASEARARYGDAVAIAKKQYEAAKSQLSKQAKGTPEPVHKQMAASIEQAYSGSVFAAKERMNSAVNALLPTPAGAFESISSIASSRLSEGLDAASSQYSLAKVAVGATPEPVQQRVLNEAQKQYYEGVGRAHARYSEFMASASSAIYGTPTPVYESVLSAAESQYSAAVAAAGANLQAAMNAASSAVGATSDSGPQSVAKAASSQYDSVVAAAAASYSALSSRASSAMQGLPTHNAQSAASAASKKVVGSETPVVESLASRASSGWEFLIHMASDQVYGQPTPYTESIGSQAREYGAQATDAVASQYSAMQDLVSQLVIGREPDFTESVMNRFRSVYQTGLPGMASSASSYVGDTYNSAASVVSSAFSPPATVEAILDSAAKQINSVVDAASAQVYGTTPGAAERVVKSASGASSVASSRASEAVHGTQAGYLKAAQSSIMAAASSAQESISSAMYGTKTVNAEAASRTAASASSAIAEAMEKARASASSLVYGPEQGALESASSRLAAAVESATGRLGGVLSDAGDSAQEVAEKVASGVSEAAEKATSAIVHGEL